MTPYKNWIFSSYDEERRLPVRVHVLYNCCNNSLDRFRLIEEVLEKAFTAGLEFGLAYAAGQDSKILTVEGPQTLH